MSELFIRERRSNLKLIKSLFFTIFLFIPTSHAENSTPVKLALLVGNWDYNLNKEYDKSPQGFYVNDLKNPCNDIELIESSLIDQGFDVSTYCNEDRKSFYDSLKMFAEKQKGLAPGSIVFIYFAGHGAHFSGSTFAIPVLFERDNSFYALKADDQRYFFISKAIDVQTALDKMTSSEDVEMVVALDMCRDSPVKVNSAYNERSKISIPTNSIVLYAASLGNVTFDGDGKYSEFALALNEELQKGGQIARIINQTQKKLKQKAKTRQGLPATDLDTGSDFNSLETRQTLAKIIKSTPSPVAASTPSPTPVFASDSDASSVKASAANEDDKTKLPVPTVAIMSASRSISGSDLALENAEPIPAAFKRKINIREADNIGTNIEIFWCKGEKEENRFKLAKSLADKLNSMPKKLRLGQITLTPLTEVKNSEAGYKVRRNVMRYDPVWPEERELLEGINDVFTDGNFLPQRGIGAHGHPTQFYVSAFVCGN